LAAGHLLPHTLFFAKGENGMKKLTFLLMVVFAVAAIGTTGCPSKSKSATATDKSSPGKTENGGGGADKDKTFTISIDPAKDVNITQGKEQKVKISVHRGKDFGKDKITISLKTDAKGISFDKEKNEIEQGTDSVNVNLVAANDAAPGKYSVTVTGDGGGKAATETIVGEIKKK